MGRPNTGVGIVIGAKFIEPISFLFSHSLGVLIFDSSESVTRKAGSALTSTYFISLLAISTLKLKFFNST